MAFIGGIISGIASIMGGIAAAKQANYQAQVAKNNQTIANQNAEYARVAGMREEEAFRIKAHGMIETQAVAQAASGVDVNVGSPLVVRAGARSLEELDALTIKNNAMRKAADFEAQSMNFAAQSDLYKMEAKNSMLQGFLGGIGSIAGAFSSVAPKWSSMTSSAPMSPVGIGPSAMMVPVVPQPGLSSPFVPAAAYRTGPGGTVVGGI